MIDFSVCIETAFTENDRSIADRVRAAADAGFPAVEIWNWRDKPLVELGRALAETGTTLHTLCAETWQDKCQLGDRGAHDEFVARVKATANVAVDLGTPKIVVLAGDIDSNRDITDQRTAAVEALTRASDAIAGLPLELDLEVVNRQFEGPNALVAGSGTALDLVAAVNRPNVKFLYDRYHAILNGEPRGWAIEGRMHWIGHIQAADVPGRHEFGTGEHDWAAELNWLIAAGYDGYVGLELIPLADNAGLYHDAQALLSR